MLSHGVQVTDAVANPGWARTLCRHRDLLVNCCLVHVDGPGRAAYYKILYQSQQPYYVGVPLRKGTETMALWTRHT